MPDGLTAREEREYKKKKNPAFHTANGRKIQRIIKSEQDWHTNIKKEQS